MTITVTIANHRPCNSPSPRGEGGDEGELFLRERQAALANSSLVTGYLSLPDVHRLLKPIEAYPRHSSRLGIGEKNLFRVRGTKVAWRPSERVRASPLKAKIKNHFFILKPVTLPGASVSKPIKTENKTAARLCKVKNVTVGAPETCNLQPILVADSRLRSLNVAYGRPSGEGAHEH